MDLSKKTLLTIFLASICINAFSEENNNGNLFQEEKMIIGLPPGGNSAKTSKVSVTEGDWTFDIVTQIEGTSKKVTSSITYYSGKNKSIVIVPSILGGVSVTRISSQAFGHHSEINAVYVPDSIEEVADWGFYDLNTADFISFANANVKIDESAFQSSGNAKLYLPSDTKIKSAGGKNVITKGTGKITVDIENQENVVIGGGKYLNIADSPYSISEEDIKSISKSTGNIVENSGSLIFKGTPYKVKEEKIETFKDFENILSVDKLNKTFKSFSKDDAEKENNKISQDSSYKDVKSILNFEEGYYVNGNKVKVDSRAVAFDVKTGEKIVKDNGLYPSTGKGKYKYVYYRDRDDDGDIDEIYYSSYEQNYTYDSVKIQSSNSNLNNLNARDIMNPVYLSFANGVIEAQNRKITLDNAIFLDTTLDGQKIEASVNQERSILWANNYGIIEAKEVNGVSTSKGNWAKMSYETGLSSYNVEIVMEWGMNALLYATNGGTVKVGDLQGNQSKFYANGDGANGVIAGGTGIKDEKSESLAETSKVYVYNAYFDLQGWNNHIADVVYGGYAYLENVVSKTGKAGSYSVGQGSALANDFGNGVVEVKDFVTTTYGNRSAGAYVIGGGVITAQNSSFTSIMDAGLVIASGGTYKIEDSKVTGQIAVRNRGGVTKDSTSTFNNGEFSVIKNYKDYTTGDKAKETVGLWEKYSGSENLSHFMMSDSEMTLGKLFENYNINETNQASLLSELSEVAVFNYTKDTFLRSSLLDNTYYNYSAGKFTGSTDFSDVPYLTVGSSFGGLVSSVIEFEAAGVNMVFNNSTFKNSNGADFNYLIASEAGSEGNVVFNNSDSQGIIWNEGDVFRVVEGRPDNRSSSLNLTFNSSDFTGSFADGDRGLWNVNGLKYKNSKNMDSSLNGNYYGASSNFGITAKFANNSNWIINRDSYLGKLVIDSSSKITAPKGFKIEMTVNGVKTSIKEGVYEGEVILKLVKL